MKTRTELPEPTDTMKASRRGVARSANVFASSIRVERRYKPDGSVGYFAQFGFGYHPDLRNAVEFASPGEAIASVIDAVNKAEDEYREEHPPGKK